MSIPFARSERSLQKDDYRLAVVCGIVALPLFIGWLLWFFAGDLPTYTLSQQLNPGEQGTVIADFAQEDVAGLQLGDSMVLHLQATDGEELAAIPVIVTDITLQPDGGYDVQLFPELEHRHIDLSSDVAGYARHRSGAHSPFRYLLQVRDDEES
ncbi:MAG: hypothetical protein AAF614_32410 [Chloroflexota bacterium]